MCRMGVKTARKNFMSYIKSNDFKSNNSRFTDGIIPPSLLVILVDMAKTRGLAVDHWFNGQGINISQLNQPGTLISFRQALTIIRRALITFTPGPVGLESGSRNPLQSFGMLGFVLMSCRNIRDVITIGIDHHQASGSLMDIEAEISTDHVILSVFERFPEPDLLPFLSEEIFASIVTLMQTIIEPNIAPIRLELNYQAPEYASAYFEFFKCPVHFNAGANRVIFDACYLEQTLVSHNPVNLQSSLELCHKLLEPTNIQKDVVASVERLLLERLRHRPTIREIAYKLNLSERTLRRQLTVSGERFCDIRDRVMEQHARALLKDSHLSIIEIALELGFNDIRDFRRAFRRWTGQTPSSLRL